MDGVSERVISLIYLCGSFLLACTAVIACFAVGYFIIAFIGAVIRKTAALSAKKAEEPAKAPDMSPEHTQAIMDTPMWVRRESMRDPCQVNIQPARAGDATMVPLRGGDRIVMTLDPQRAYALSYLISPETPEHVAPLWLLSEVLAFSGSTINSAHINMNTGYVPLESEYDEVGEAPVDAEDMRFTRRMDPYSMQGVRTARSEDFRTSFGGAPPEPTPSLHIPTSDEPRQRRLNIRRPR